MSLQDTLDSEASNTASEEELDADSGFEHDDDRNEETIEAPLIKVRDPRQEALEIDRRRRDFTDRISNEMNEEEQTKLYAAYKGYLGPLAGDVANYLSGAQKNILHWMVENSQKDQEHAGAWAIGRLASDYPKLLEEDKGVEALCTAVSNKHVWFLKRILASGVPTDTLQRALGPTASDGQTSKVGDNRSNCIIEAVKEGLDIDVTIQLVKIASRHTLEAPDSLGRTALHYAVEGKRCTAGQIKVIEALLERGGGALDQYDISGKSVFEYHLSTRRGPHKKKSSSSTKLSRRTKRSDELGKVGRFFSGIELDIESKTRDDESVQRLEENGKERSLLSPVKEKDDKWADGSQSLLKPRRRPTFQPEDTRSRASSRASQPLPNEGRHRSDHRSAMSPSRDIEPSKRKTKKKVQETDDRPSLHWEKVADLLKLHFLRSTFVPSNATTEYPKRRHNDAERFLFGSNSDNKSLCFSFPPTARKSVTIDFEDFKQGYSSMTFDKTLLYVNFGQFDLTQPDKGPRTVRNRATGRDDLGKFFSWLQEKQVRYIIKVMVSEDSKRPHSDEAIINALKPFQVEILDWQKLDLCPAVLQEVGKDWSNLHEIHLRWSGNNAVLRAWSEPEGLAMLEHLTTLHVYETERPLDSATYIGERVEEFKGRLNAARKGHRAITVVHHPFDGPTNGFMGKRKTGTQILDQGPKAETMNEHLWLTIMDRFVQAIRKLEADRPPEYPGDFKNDKNIRESLKKDITVALIDDGVNFMNRAVSRNLMGGKCFPSEFGDDGGSVAGAPDPPFHGSSTEHGTRMAYFIQRICPAVKIFVCKIDVMQRPDEKANFTAKSAADAVEYAVEHEFDIVSMSWTVEEDSTSSNSRDHFNRIQKALERKDRRMPLLFCSAPDIGHHKTNDYYPFGCKSITNMFRIGAATVDGLAHPRVSDDVDYILPGHNVLPHSNDLVGTDGPMTPMTGSSVATALAAGLAALIIHCVRLGAIYNATRSSDVPASRYSLSDKSLETIKTYSAMRAAFDFIKGKELPGASEKRLGVEGCFKDPGDDLAKREKDFHSDSEVAAWETVREIARNLVPYDPSYGKGRQ